MALLTRVVLFDEQYQRRIRISKMLISKSFDLIGEFSSWESGFPLMENSNPQILVINAHQMEHNLEIKEYLCHVHPSLELIVLLGKTESIYDELNSKKVLIISEEDFLTYESWCAV